MSKYDDMLKMPHKQSQTRPHMSAHDRAAQFAPFAALVGYGAAVKETARQVGERVTLSEDMKSDIDMKLNLICEHIDEQPEINITYFLPDKKKSGGEYVSAVGYVMKINTLERSIVFQGGTVIPVTDIYEVTGDVFERYNLG